jgi:hypothetical protein
MNGLETSVIVEPQGASPRGPRAIVIDVPRSVDRAHSPCRRCKTCSESPPVLARLDGVGGRFAL